MKAYIYILRRFPAFLSLLMLGALSLRLGLPFIVAIPLTMFLLAALLIPNGLLQTALSFFLWASCLIWPFVGWMRVNERLAFDQPWMRLATIFIGVTLFTGWSAWMLRRRS